MAINDRSNLQQVCQPHTNAHNLYALKKPNKFCPISLKCRYHVKGLHFHSKMDLTNDFNPIESTEV